MNLQIYFLPALYVQSPPQTSDYPSLYPSHAIFLTACAATHGAIVQCKQVLVARV
ncbi:MAG: hypothetical protein ABW199_12530 [Caulobacterales bacterium]